MVKRRQNNWKPHLYKVTLGLDMLHYLYGSTIIMIITPIDQDIPIFHSLFIVLWFLMKLGFEKMKLNE